LSGLFPFSCPRPGGQPATLEGLWNCEKLPPWHSDYTVNINTEMNYMPRTDFRLQETSYATNPRYENMLHRRSQNMFFECFMFGAY